MEFIINNSNTPVPVIYHKILPRNDIFQIINSTLPDEIICFIAPYGCGKTLAVMSWLQENDLNANWVDLSKKPDTETELIEDLTAAITSTEKENFLTNLTYLENPQAFLWHEISKLNECDRKKVLVIDNFQSVSNVKLLRFLERFVSVCLGYCCVIIISRIELPTVFNNLILKGYIRFLTPSELNFSLQETINYFEMSGYTISESDVEKIHSDTEGWPAALNAILATSHKEPFSYGQTARDYIMTFFEMEVWSGLKDDIKIFLMKTSVLEKLAPSVCYAVTGIGTSLAVLKWLLINGLFISKMEAEEEHTYVFHRVFRDFLMKKLDASDIDKSELYTKVGWWFFEKKEMAKSFPYFFKSNDYYGINQVLKILNLAELGIEKYLEMAECITELNPENLKYYPILIAKIALIHFLKGNIKEMQRLCLIINTWLKSDELMITPEEYGECMWEVGWLVYIDPDENVMNNLKHYEWSNYEEYMPNIKPTHSQRFGVLRLPSAISGIRDYCSAVDTVDWFIKYNEETGRSIIRGEYALCETELINAEYAYETENFAKSEEILRKIMVLAESKKHTDLYFVCTVILVKIMRVMNNTKEISPMIDRLETMIANNNHNFLLPNFHAFELRNKLLDGETGFTDIFLEENEKYKNSLHYYLLYRHITYVRGLLSLESYSEAMLVLGNLELLCSKHNRTMDLIEVNILKAAASYGLKYKSKACDYLDEALKTAEKYNFIRIFSDNAASIWNILNLLKKQSANKYVQNVIISCKKTLSKSGYKFSDKKHSHIELTKAELKILKSLQAGMSYTEIALDNNVRISTVKSHIHSIYSKLEVKNRTSAIITATEQGIID